MNNKKHVGTFYSVDTVLYKVTELEAQGYAENQICGVAGIDDMIAMLQGETEIELQGGNGESSVLEAFLRMGFSKQQAHTYFQEVKDGGIALFVEDVKPVGAKGSIDEMDSAVELSRSGEQLDGQNEQQQLIENEETIPRINTENL